MIRTMKNGQNDLVSGGAARIIVPPPLSASDRRGPILIWRYLYICVYCGLGDVRLEALELGEY